MAIPADGEITAAMLVLLGKPRRERVFPDPYFYVKELRLAVNSHLALDKILEVVEPLAEGFDGKPRKPVVEVHRMAEDRERKVIVLAERKAVIAPVNVPPMPHRGHIRTESELAYLQDSEIPATESVVRPQPVPVKRGVRIDEEVNTEKTISLVISNPTKIDHGAQAVGGGILKSPPEPFDTTKPPGSLEILRQTLGRPSRDWPTWTTAAPTTDTSLHSGLRDEDSGHEKPITEIQPPEERKDPSAVETAEPNDEHEGSQSPSQPRSPISGPSSPVLSMSGRSDNSTDDADEGETSDTASTLCLDADSEFLLSDRESDDGSGREPPTPLLRKAFDGVTIGSVRPEEASAAIKSWVIEKWKYIAMDLSVIVGMAVFLHFLGL